MIHLKDKYGAGCENPLHVTPIVILCGALNDDNFYPTMQGLRDTMPMMHYLKLLISPCYKKQF